MVELRDDYQEWYDESQREYEGFRDNKTFRSMLERLQECNLELGSKAQYYYYGNSKKIVETTRALYYKGYGLFTINLYFDTETERNKISVRLLRKAEGNNKKIQDISVLLRT